MTNGRTDQLNAFITLLTNSVAAPDLTITVDNAPVLALPYYLVIDPLTASREYVLVTGAAGNVLTVTRSLSGTGSTTHLAGEPVVIAPMAQHFEDLWDVVDSVGGSIDHADLANVLPEQHHTKYTDGEAIAAVGPHTTLHSDLTDVAALPDAHHTRYTDPEAVSAVAAADVYVQLIGDTMGGLLILSGDPVVDLGAATKQYVDSVPIPGSLGQFALDAGTADSRPGAGLFRRNNPVPASVTFLFFDFIDDNGVDLRDETLNFKAGSVVYVTTTDGLVTEAYNVVVDAVDATTYSRVGVTFNQQVGTIAALDVCTFSIFGGGLADATYLRRDGANSPTAIIPWAGFRISGLGPGQTGTDAANLDNIDTKITTHGNIVDVHHARYTDGEADSRVTIGIDAHKADIIDPHAAAGYLTSTSADLLYVRLGGDTMTGLLVLSDDPAVDLGAATKRYVDANHIIQTTEPVSPQIGDIWVNEDTPIVGTFLLLTGGTLSGALEVQANLHISGGNDLLADGNIFQGVGFPVTPWSGATGVMLGALGSVGTQGSFGVDLAGNWSRTTTGRASLNANGQSGATNIQLLPDGRIIFGADAVYGAVNAPTTRFEIQEGLIRSHVNHRFQDGDISTPSITFQSNTGSGWRLRSGDQVAASVGGGDRMWIANDGVYIRVFQSSGGPADVEFNGSGRLDQVSSARRFKKDIEPLAAGLVDIVLEPVTFTWKDTDKKYIGFIADDLADQDERMAKFSDKGLIGNYDIRAIVAILAAKVNRLEAT